MCFEKTICKYMDIYLAVWAVFSSDIVQTNHSVIYQVLFTSLHKFPFLFCCFVTRGRKPGSGRKNGGAGSKGKDKKLSGTESEQEVGIDLDTDVIICVWEQAAHLCVNLF